LGVLAEGFGAGDLGGFGAGVVRGLARSADEATLFCWRVFAGWRGMIPRGIESPVSSCRTRFIMVLLPSTAVLG
jgi:hypothetical protein